MVSSISLGDIDILGSSGDRLDLTYNQLGDGSITAEASAIALDGAWISKQSADLSLSFRGRVGHGLAHLRLWTHRVGKISAGGTIAEPRQVFLALPNEAVDVTVLGPSCSLGFTIEIDKLADRLTTEASAMLSRDTGAHRFIDVDAESLAALIQNARFAFGMAHYGPGFALDGGEMLRRDLLDEVANLLNDAASERRPPPQPHYSPSIVDALRVMMEHLTEPLTLQQLCRACGWSKRSMIYHFSNTLGITPMAYFKLQRLNAVRRALKHADPRNSRVLDIAADYGFFHMGHFAVDYRQLFGVLPSQTLGVSRRPSEMREGEVEELAT
ncbi:MAG TPA: helix-turn-helix domain-containing protein [Candidatus Limnocylindria bacterium]|nr:helix-turn-helix domain-containing protein [Candidatus Limnocylindria bacterium]